MSEIKFTKVATSLEEINFPQGQPVVVVLLEKNIKIGDGEIAKNEEDKKKGIKAFQAHRVLEYETGVEGFINKAYAIDKLIDEAERVGIPNDKSLVLRITFLEKTEVNNRPLNKYETEYAFIDKI